MKNRIKISLLAFFSLLSMAFFVSPAKAFTYSDIIGYFPMDFNSSGALEMVSNKYLDKTGTASDTYRSSTFGTSTLIQNNGSITASHFFASSTSGMTNSFSPVDGEDFSVSFWRKKNADPAVEAHLISMNYTGGTNFSFHQQGTAENLQYISIDLDHTGTRQWTSTYPIDNTGTNWNNWIITGTWGDPLSFNIYLDGVQQTGNWNNSTSYTTTACNSIYCFEIGARGNGYGFNGYLDDVGYFSKKLTAQDISDLQTQTIAQVAAISANVFSVDYMDFTDNALISVPQGTVITNYPSSGQVLGHCENEGDAILYQHSNLPFYVSWANAVAQSGNSINCQYSTAVGHESELIWYSNVVFNYGTNIICFQATTNWDEDLDTYDLVGSPACLTTVVSAGTNTAGTAYSTSSVYSTLGQIDAYDLACSATEWADTSWWTQIRCSTFYSLLYIPIGVVNFGMTSISYLTGLVSNIFPFNLAFQIYDSWDDSSVGGLPSALSYFDQGDANGNFYIYVPSAWSGGATTSVLVFGEGITGGNTLMDNFFAGIRAISTYLMWAGFIYFIYAFGKKIYEESIGDNDKN